MTPPLPGPEPHFARWPWWRRWLGRRAERAAARFLRSLGYRVLAANTTAAGHELDLLALDGPMLVVVEVRSTAADTPEALEQTAATVDQRKQQRLTRATLGYLAARGLLGRISVRFDVLVLGWPPQARQPTVRHLRDAFAAAGRYQFFS